MLLWVLIMILPLLEGQQSPVVEYYITEELAEHTIIGNIATDANLDLLFDKDVFNQLRYTFLAQSNKEEQYLHIQENTGIIQTSKRIDRDTICPEESLCVLNLDVAVSPHKYFQVIPVRVEIKDLNDNSPKFPVKEITHHISESAQPDTAIGIPSAEDPDSKDFGIRTYELVSLDQDAFDLKVSYILDGSTDLQLVLLKQLDREVQDYYMLEVVAQDGGKPPNSGSIIVHITVDDTNDNHPKFDYESYEIDVYEDTEAGTTITNVIAHDADAGQNGQITYSFSTRTQKNYGHIFGIEPTTGAMYLKHELDYESDTIYHLVVKAVDGGPDKKASHATVIVRVLDVNDSPPQITINTLTPSGEAQISEASKVNTFVAHVSVNDFDAGPNGQVSCMLSSDKFKLVKMDSTKYKIVTAVEFDREVEDSFDIIMECKDHGDTPMRTMKEMHVSVIDVNDHAPKFTKHEYSAAIDENNFVTAFVVTVSANDVDIGANGRVHYRIDDNQAAALFQLDPNTGVIRAGIEFDHEEINEIRFPVIAYDEGDPAMSSTATVSVAVRDVNDSPPEFSQITYSFSVFENMPAGIEVGNVAAFDADSAPYNKVQYFLAANKYEQDQPFELDRTTGWITTTKELDRELNSIYYLDVKAVNDDYTPLSSTASVIIYVSDRNDNSPVIEYPNASNNSLRISSYVPRDSKICHVKAIDMDEGTNAFLEYGLHGAGRMFSIDKDTGDIFVTGDLSRIIHHQFNLTVKVDDKGKVSQTSAAPLFILVSNTIPYHNPSDKQSSALSFLGSNSIILIGVACGSIFIIMVLLCAIVIIKCQSRRHSNKASGKYNCRTEAEKMLANEKKSPSSPKRNPEGSHNPGVYQTRSRHQNGGVNQGTLSKKPVESHAVSPSGGTTPTVTFYPHHTKQELETQEEDGNISTADSGRSTAAGDDPDLNTIYSGNYVSFSPDINDRPPFHNAQTITIDTKKNMPSPVVCTSPVPKLSTFAPRSPSSTLPPSFSKQQIKIDDPCGCHGNTPIIVNKSNTLDKKPRAPILKTSPILETSFPEKSAYTKSTAARSIINPDKAKVKANDSVV